MIIRLHAMYQESRIMLAFLVVVFLALTITSIVIMAVQRDHYSFEEFILSGTYQCVNMGGVVSARLTATTWILGAVWEVLALCLAIRVAVKHICESRRFRSTGQIIGDCFTVLIKTHVLYFTFFAAVSCFILGSISPEIWNSISVGVQVYFGILNILLPLQMFVLGPRLILSIRQYHAKLMANSEAGTGITTISFQDPTNVSTSGGMY